MIIIIITIIILITISYPRCCWDSSSPRHDWWCHAYDNELQATIKTVPPAGEGHSGTTVNTSFGMKPRARGPNTLSLNTRRDDPEP